MRTNANQLRRELARKTADCMRTGRLLRKTELLALYRQRRHVTPTRDEAKFILASMRCERLPGLRLRERELGWFWLRRFSIQELRSLLADPMDKRPAPADVARADNSGPAPVAKSRTQLRRELNSSANIDSGPEQAAALRLLAQFRDKADLPLIRRRAQEEHFSVRWAAAEALGQFQNPKDISLLATLARRMKVGPSLDALLRYRGDVAVVAIHGLAQDADACLRGNLAVQLDRWRHKDKGAILRRLARDVDPWPRCAAVSSLGALRRAKDLPLMRSLAHDADPRVRREAVWAVGQFRRTKNIGLLKKRLCDEAPNVRTVAAMALARLMPRIRLENWMDTHLGHLSFEVLREFDFALYAPAWIKRSMPRAADNDIRLHLGMCQPDLGGSQQKKKL